MSFNRMTVYVIRFQSSGETWKTTVCESDDTLFRILRNHSMVRIYDSANGYWMEYQNPTDKSQTAIVVKHDVIP